jgi:hypothetical protein
MKKLLAGVVLTLGLVGCGATQSADCKKYVDCQKAVSASAGAALDSTYGATGSCWTTTPAAADACTAACKSAITALAMANPDQAACK